MGNEMIQIDIESIMDEIRNNIKQRGYNINNLSFKDVIAQETTAAMDDFSLQTLYADLSDANRLCNIQTNHEILSNKRLVVFVKKLIRKLTQFYVAPIIDEQRLYNEAVVRCLNQVNGYINLQQDNNELLEDIHYEINKNIKKNINLIDKNYNEIIHENAELKNMVKDLVQKQKEQDAEIKILMQKLEITNIKYDKLSLMLEECKEN